MNYLDPPTDEQWIEFYQKLRLFTFKKYAGLNLSLGVDLEDIVNEAVADVLDGKRIWNRSVWGPSATAYTPEQQLSASFFGFLCGVVQSKISHLRERSGRQESLDAIEPHFSSMVNRYDRGGSSLTRSSLEDQINFNEVTEKMEELVSEDEASVRIIGALREVPDLSPQEIAKETGLSIGDIYNALKRIRRKLKR